MGKTRALELHRSGWWSKLICLSAGPWTNYLHPLSLSGLKWKAGSSVLPIVWIVDWRLAVICQVHHNLSGSGFLRLSPDRPKAVLGVYKDD